MPINLPSGANDREGQRFQSSFECYLAVIDAVPQNAVEVTAELAREFQIRARTAREAPPSGMADFGRRRLSRHPSG